MHTLGVSKQFVDEFVTGASRDNYNQDSRINAFVDLVSLAGAGIGGSVFYLASGGGLLLQLAIVTHIAVSRGRHLGRGHVRMMMRRLGRRARAGARASNAAEASVRGAVWPVRGGRTGHTISLRSACASRCSWHALSTQSS